jgi:hypothetical protein
MPENFTQNKKQGRFALLLVIFFIVAAVGLFLFFIKDKKPSLTSCVENKDGTLSGIYTGEFMTLRRTACVNNNVVASYCVAQAQITQSVIDCPNGCEYTKLAGESLLTASCRKKPFSLSRKNSFGEKSNYLNITSAVGTNVSPIDENNTEFAFIDLMKRSGKCTSENGLGAQLFDVDDYGYARSLLPGQVCKRVILSAEAEKFLPVFFRHLVVLYQGNGTINYEGNVKVISSEPGRDVIELAGSDKNQADDGFGIKITALPDPKDYIRDIHIIPLGGTCGSDIYSTHLSASDCKGKFASFENNFRNNPFVPEFLGKIIYLNGGLSKQKDPTSVIRFAKWTNPEFENKDLLTWQNRATFDSSTWTDLEKGGVPVEILVQLANLTRSNPWFSFSGNSEDDYISKFAVYVRDHLDPDLKVYIENGDEPWQKNTALDQNEILIFAKRSGEIFQIWSKVFGVNDKNKLVRIIKSDINDLEMANTLMNWCSENLACDALAIAPFVEVKAGEIDRISNITVDQLIDYLQGAVLLKMKNPISAYVNLAEKFNIPLITYEGGVTLGANAKLPPGVDDSYLSVMRNQRLYDLYTDLLNQWRQLGGKLFVNFTDIALYTKFNKNGSAEYLTQPLQETPKVRALYDWAQQNRPWW